MQTYNHMILHVYDGDWGLPSIDLDCIKLLTVIELMKVPVEINRRGNPFNSPNGFLPYLSVDKQKICGYNGIMSYFKRQGFNVNENLTQNTNDLASAYMAYFEKNLFPYYYYYLWGEPTNAEHSRTFYAKKTPVPFNFFYPKKYIDKTNKMTENFYDFSIFNPTDSHNIDNIIIDARKCINLLSQKIDDKQWLFGGTYSECDATIYAYLSILYNIKLPENPIKSHINACPNLVKYINKISKKYFPKYIVMPEIPTKLQRKMSDDDNEGMTWKTKALVGVIGFIALLSFSLIHGILSISANDEDEFSTIGNYYDDEADGSDD